MTMRTCDVEDCERKHAANGLCLMHYKRLKRNGALELPTRTKAACEHCDRDAIAHGWCDRHYRQWRLHGDPLHADRHRAEAGDSRESRGYTFARGSMVPDHRRITEAGPGEVVHHINGLKTDNDIDNLVVLTGQSEHRRVHASLEAMAFQLVRNGLITFDRACKQYVLTIQTIGE